MEITQRPTDRQSELHHRRFLRLPRGHAPSRLLHGIRNRHRLPAGPRSRAPPAIMTAIHPSSLFFFSGSWWVSCLTMCISWPGVSSRLGYRCGMWTTGQPVVVALATAVIWSSMTLICHTSSGSGSVASFRMEGTGEHHFRLHSIVGGKASSTTTTAPAVG